MAPFCPIGVSLEFTYQQLFARHFVAVVRTEVKECVSVVESSIHVHEKVDEFGHVRVLVDLQAQIIAC